MELWPSSPLTLCVAKIFSTHYQHVTCVFGRIYMIRAFQKHIAGQFLLSQWDFISANVFWWPFFAWKVDFSTKFRFGSSKRGCGGTWVLTLWVAKKFFAHHKHVIWVLAGFLVIIPTRRNNRGQFTMRQSHSAPPNVSWQHFFMIHTPQRAFRRRN